MSYIYQWPRYKITCDVAYFWNNKLLILKRSIEPEKGKYSLPGGNLNPDELLVDCAKRELYEETKLKVDELTLISNFDAIGRSSGDRSVSCLYFYENTEKQEPAVLVQLAECESFCWITQDEIRYIDWAFDCKDMAYESFIFRSKI